MPSSDPNYHSKLIWFQGSHVEGAFFGGVWKWKPSAVAAENACTNYLSSSFTAQSIPSAGADVFCSGHVPLSDASGRMLFTGGTEGGQEIGIRSNRIFDPSTGTWSDPGDMGYRRWYPTATRLKDGRALIASGNSYNHVHIFGGKKSVAGLPINELHRYGTSLAGDWDSQVPAAAPWPPERHAHATPATQSLFDVRIFGGVGADGLLRKDLWSMTRDQNPSGSDYVYVWENRTPNPAEGPSPRKNASIVVFDDAESETTYVFGGIGAGGTVHGDFWKLYKVQGAWVWQHPEITPGPNDPGPRWGHTAVFWRDGTRRRILVFGGAATSTGTPVDNEVYSLELKDATSLQWTRLTPRNDIQNGRPAPRIGHGMVIDGIDRLRAPGVAESRMVVFGGKGTFAPDGYTNDAWHLWIAADGQIEWKELDVVNSPPSRRAWHATSLDGAFVRLLAFGGEGATGIADGSMWSLEPNDLTHPYDSMEWKWQQRATQSFSLTGATSLRFHSVVFSRVPEIFNPAGSPTWTALTNAPLLQDWYPFNFVLPGSDKVFNAGPSNQSYQLDVAGGGPWVSFPGASGFVGGSAVMYEPGKVMKCGTRDTEGLLVAAVGTTKISFPTSTNPSEQAWRTSGSMTHGRVNHNLVTLPNGKVMVFGGTGVVNNTGNLNPVYRPEIWDPAANGGLGAWSGGSTLALAGGIRGYHSVALLLPDSRVVVSGGEGETNPNRQQAEVYCPPYLFRPDGQPAPQPRIVNAPTAAGYGQTIRICATASGTVDAVTACLIAPGSTTHGFDQNQRFVPLSVSHLCGTAYDIVTPADASHAPPGYYMLFVVNNLGVPSIAAWLRLDPNTPTPPPVCTGDCSGGCPVVDTRTSEGWEAENTVLSRSTTGTLEFDSYRLKATPEVRGGRLTLRLREDEQERTTLDEVRVVAVDHPPGVTVLGAGAEVVAGNRVPAHRITTSRGEDITALLAGGSAAGWRGAPGDTVWVEFDPPDAGRYGLTATQDGGGGTGGGGDKEVELVSDPASGGGRYGMQGASTPAAATDAEWLDLTGIRVQVPDGSDGWQDLTRWYPREQPDDAYFPGLTHPRARLIFVGRHRLTFFGRMKPSATGVVKSELARLSATHSRLGDVRGDLTPGANATELASGDTLTLEFAASPVPEGLVRDYLLVTNGVYTSNIPAARLTPRGAELPGSFALLQNVPNPFASTTAIAFQLPRAGRVKLEVFDLLGRRVKTLTDASWPAGAHQLEWDRRTDAGLHVPPGVYLYRMNTDGFRDQKKMVIGAR